MRLRELASTQAVVFFAPPEVHQSIQDVCNLRNDAVIDSSHVVAWLLEQTCRANEQLRGLYLAQGHDYCRRLNAQLQNPHFLTSKTQRRAVLNAIRQPERQTLEELYGAQSESPSSPTHKTISRKLRGFVQELTRQQEAANKCSGWASHNSAMEEVEQEREVEFQIEVVRQRQEAPDFVALRFPGLHDNIRHFVKTGDLSGEGGYEHAFHAIASTSTGKKYGVRATKSRLFVSAEYMRTIVLEGRTEIDDFLVRPTSSFPRPSRPVLTLADYPACNP